MWTYDNGAARLERDQYLIDRRRCRVRGGHDRGDDAERLANLDNLLVFDSIDNAYGLHRLDELVYLARAEQVFLNLVGDDAVAGFLHGKARERLGVKGHRVSHGGDDGVDLFLGEFRENRLRLPGGGGKRPSLRDRLEILVRTGRAILNGHRRL